MKNAGAPAVIFSRKFWVLALVLSPILIAQDVYSHLKWRYRRNK